MPSRSSTDSDDDSDDIFSEVFNREPYEDDSDDSDIDSSDNRNNRGSKSYSDDDYDDDSGDDFVNESGRSGMGGALTSVEGSNDINREGKTDHKYTTADMKSTPMWQRCLQIILMFVCFLICMMIVSWFFHKIFWSEELKPDDYYDDNPTAPPKGADAEDNVPLPKGRTFIENRCSGTNIGGSLRPFCETACEPYTDCCADIFARQNGTCYAKEFAGCYSYAKCSALSDKSVLDPAPVDLDRLCSANAISISPEDCKAACESARCCWDDAMGSSCKATYFDVCQDYSQCQNLRMVTTSLDIVPVAETDLDIHCKNESPKCKRACLDGRCCNNQYSDCYRDNFIACLSYSSCNYMEESGVIINVPELFSVMSPAPSDIGMVCRASAVETNAVPCETACEPAKCCFASGVDNCFGDDPLGCQEYADCAKIYKDISQIVNPVPTEQPTPQPLVHNRQFIINNCGEVELGNQEDRNNCYDLCEPSFECCDPFKSDTSYDCYVDEMGACYSYSRCHAVTDDGEKPSPDNLGQVCDFEALKTGESLEQCAQECADVACCWDYMDGSVPPCLDQKFIICQDYLPCQNLKAYEMLLQAGQIQSPTSTPTSSPTSKPTSSPTLAPTTLTPTTLTPTAVPTIKVTPINITGLLDQPVTKNDTSTTDGSGTSSTGGGRSRRQQEQPVNDSNVADSNGSSTPVQGNGVGIAEGNNPSNNDQLVIAVAHTDFDQVCKENVELCTATCNEVKPCCDDPNSKCYKDNFMACLSYAVCPTHTTAKRIGELYSVIPKQNSTARQNIDTECSAQAIEEKDSIEECQLHCNVAKCCFAHDDLDEYCFDVDPLGCLQYFACGILYNLPNIEAISHLQPSDSVVPDNSTTTVVIKEKPVQDTTAFATPPLIIGGQNITTGLGGHTPENPVTESPAESNETEFIVETTPVDSTIGETTPVDSTVGETTPVDSTVGETTPVNSTPTDTTPENSNQADTTPENSTAVETTPVNSTPADTTPVNSTAVEITPTNTSLPETAQAETSSPETSEAETSLTEAVISSSSTPPPSSTSTSPPETTEADVTTAVVTPKENLADASLFLYHRPYMQDLCRTELVGSAATESGGADSAPCFSACDSVKFQDCCDPFDQSNTCYSQAGCYSYARCHTKMRVYAPPQLDLSRDCDPTGISINPLNCFTPCSSLRCCWDSSVGSCWAKHFDVCSDYSACQNLRNIMPPEVQSSAQQATIMNGAEFLPVATPKLDSECKKGSTVCQSECKKAELCCSDSNSACYRDNFMSCLSYSACVENPTSSIPAVHIPLPVHYSTDIPYVNDEDISSACFGPSANAEDCRKICEPSACCFKNPATESCFGKDPFGCAQYSLCQAQNVYPMETG